MPNFFPILLFTVCFSIPVFAQSESRNAPITGPTIVYPGRTIVQQGSATRSGTAPGSTSRTQPIVTNDTPVRSAPATFEQKFWNYLLRAKYRNWAPVPGQSDAMYEGQSPHGAYLKMYLNRTAAGSPKDLPNGSIVIKENYGPDKKTLMAITAMYKTRGYNAKAGDWYWVKYNPNGTVATKSTDTGAVIRLAGQVNGCISCHDGADGGDFAFLND